MTCVSRAEEGLLQIINLRASINLGLSNLPCGRCLSLYLLNAKYIFIFSFQVLSLAFDQPRAKEIKELSSN
jgi:hypothetical protein